MNRKTKIGITVALAIGACAAAFKIAALVGRQRDLQEFVAARTALEENLTDLLPNIAVLKMAARAHDASPGNRELAACLLGDGTCTSTDPDRQVGFVVRTGMSPADPRIAGTDDTPALYSGSGKLGCDRTSDQECPGWQVNVWFYAECPNNAKTCPKAARLHVRQQIRAVGNLAGLAASPPDDRFRSDSRLFARAVEVQ